MTRTAVLLADDHAFVREGLRVLVDAQPDLRVVGEAATADEAVAALRAAPADVLCLDLSMPGGGAADTIARAKAAAPDTRVLVLTMHDEPAYVRVVLAAGADGYLHKSAAAGRVLDAIRAVHAGRPVLPPDMPAAAPARHEPLSKREKEVLDLLAKGHTHKEISDKLFVSVKTIETYRARVREKTGLRTRADFVRYGLDLGPASVTPPPAE